MSAPDPLDENDLLAAEFALGVLADDERARAEAMMKSSPSFAARVTEWESRLAPLAEEIAPIPAPNLLPAIEARLFGRKRARGRFGLPKGWFVGLLTTGAMAALSVVVLAVMLEFGGAGISVPVQTATLQADGSGVQYLARSEGDQITLTRIKGDAAATGRSYELWVIDGDAAPVSLGLIDQTLTLPAPKAKEGYVLAITDEPFGGGPGGKPTGAVIALGKFDES